MRQVDPSIYSGVDRGERRRIARELERGKERHLQGLEDARRIRAMSGTEEERKRNEALAARIEDSTARPPIALLACAGCHRPTPLCTCVDSDGHPLAWN